VLTGQANTEQAADSVLSKSKLTLIVAQCIVACILSQSAILLWFGFSVQTSIIDSTISICLLGIACYLIANNLQYYRPEKNGYLLMLLYCSILASLWLLVNNYTLDKLILNDPHYSEFLYNSLPIRFFIGLLILASTAFGWVYAMKHIKLATLGVVYSVSTVLLLAFVGVIFFQESLNPYEIGGIVLAVASLILLSAFS